MRKAGNITVTALLSAVFVLLGVFVFRQSYLRFWEAVCDLGRSVGYCFCEICGTEHGITPTVTEYSGVMQRDIVFPSDFAGFQTSAKKYVSLLFSKDNFTAWGQTLGRTLGTAAKILSVLLPCCGMFVVIVRRMYAKDNNRYGRDTLPLSIFKKIMNVTYQPAKRFTLSYLSFLKAHRYVVILWLVLWAVQLNLATVLIAAFAYVLYFTVSFDVAGLYTQIVKLFIDLQPVFRCFPWWVLLMAVYPLFHRWRKRVAVNRLRHNEAKNCGFINELPVVSITCGSMGKRKTTMITDMTLSQEVMFRQKALSILQNTDLKFPYFPWILFEQELQKCMEHGTVYNLAAVKEWVKLKRQRFLKHRNAGLQLYGYDCKRYGAAYDDALKTSSLFDALETYAQAYFIYVLQGSLIVSNYAIRTDNGYADAGNLPMWLTDFFPDKRRKSSRRSHILDFDVLRLGKKVLENNPNAGSFEFGVVAITEIGKERGNNLELKEVKKGSMEPTKRTTCSTRG